MAENIPNLPIGAVPPKKETGKVQPKKETVRINLPPKPSAAPTIKLPTLPPGGPPAPTAAAPTAATLTRAAAAPAAAPRAGAPAAAVQRPTTTQRPVAVAAVPTVSFVDNVLAIAAAVVSVAAAGIAYYLWTL